jgi:uncharacterized protein (DUF433 family)
MKLAPEGDTVKTETIEIVDRGRGTQLSTSRITVQDLLPYYQEGASNEDIRRWLPSLTEEEIAVLKYYIRQHYEEVLQAEKEIKAYHDRMRAAQPSWTRANDHLSLEERKALLQEKLAERKAKKTVLTILVDENIDGYAEYLSRFVFSPAWSDISCLLGVRIVKFEEVGLVKGTPDE